MTHFAECLLALCRKIDTFSIMSSHSWSRRAFLASSAALFSQAGTAAAQETPAPAAAPFRNPSIYRFNIGEIEAFSISDGHSLIRPAMGMMHPEIDRPVMQKIMEDNFERLDGIPLYVNILLLRKGKEVAIFDAGFGKGGNSNWGWFFDALDAINIKREDVTAAFLSHAHIDHIAGFVLNDAIAFPNAEFYCTQEELDFWFTKEPDFSKSKRDKGELPGLTRDNRKRFDILKPNTKTLKHGSSVWGGDITLELAPGHTAGHAIFRIQSKGESLLHIMDLAHHHLLMFENVNWTIAFDHDPELAVVTRKKVYAQALSEKTRLYGFHLPWPAIGHLGPKSADSYVWIPERFSWGS
jgi:glyoxylase-like metal-dependent hydrolase (beta-lactamase superfamily II)